MEIVCPEKKVDNCFFDMSDNFGGTNLFKNSLFAKIPGHHFGPNLALSRLSKGQLFSLPLYGIFFVFAHFKKPFILLCFSSYHFFYLNVIDLFTRSPTMNNAKLKQSTIETEWNLFIDQCMNISICQLIYYQYINWYISINISINI